jgi:hypothetical protein
MVVGFQAFTDPWKVDHSDNNVLTTEKDAGRPFCASHRMSRVQIERKNRVYRAGFP